MVVTRGTLLLTRRADWTGVSTRNYFKGIRDEISVVGFNYR